MTIVLLVRHGVTDATGKRLYGRSEGIHLSEEGSLQAKRIAERLSELPLAALYTSPLERCVETAEVISEACGLEVRPLDDVIEVDYGDLTGRTFAAIRRTKLWQQVHRFPSTVRFPKGESFIEAQRRQVDALERLSEDHPKEIVVAVSHGDPIRLAVAHYVGLPLDLYQRLEVTTGSVSAIAVGGVGPRLLKLNDSGTLDDVVPPRARGRRGGRHGR